MKKLIFAILSVGLLVFVAIVWAGTVSEQPYGWAFPKWYSYSGGAASDYYLEHPTLTGNDQVVSEDATQTLTNKTLTTATLTSPVINAPTTTTGIGAANGTGVTATEYGEGVVHKTVLTMSDLTVALTDEAGQVAWLGQKVYDFPAGAIMFIGATADLVCTLSAAGVDADWEGDFGLGTATAAADDTLTSTEDDLLPTTATAAATASVGAAKGQSTAAEIVVFDGTTTAIDMFLNQLVDDADHDVTTTATDMIYNGTITFYWINLGDY
jgi:hypothetical protein